MRRVPSENAYASRGNDSEKAPKKRLTDDQHSETKEQGRVTQLIAPIAGRSELQERQAESRQHDRYAQIYKCYEIAKRRTRIVGKDFRRNLRHARFVLEVFGFLVLSFYAWQAYRQRVEMTKSVDQQVAANDLAREHAAIELRAYVNVQAEHGDAVILVADPKTKETRVSISFYNAGQTPAHNFRDSFATGGVSKSTGSFSGDKIQRFQAVGNGPWRGVMSGGGGPDIPARSAHTEYLPTDQMPSEKEWDDIEQGKKTLTIWGNYEYCDEFGGYHCRMLQFDYQITPKAGFVPSSFTDMNCFTQPAVPPDEPAPMKVLTRCRDLEEQKKDQAYADSNAGKVFPAHTGKSESGVVQFNGVSFGKGRNKPTATPTK